MKIALKYGLLITACFIVWVVVAHRLFPDPHSMAHSVGASVFVNLVQIAAIVLGMRARKNKNGGYLLFKDGLKTGVSISAVYAVSASLFFVVALMFFGSALMAVEPGADIKPLWQVALWAFLGLGLGAVLFGLIYSAVASFVLASRKE
ncbi:MAG TPA: DUF4199 family protein [Pyrinomonadaceae bacterium]|nr:DUF4199 family protein [Pyrinomonadaceae bacterium]